MRFLYAPRIMAKLYDTLLVPDERWFRRDAYNNSLRARGRAHSHLYCSANPSLHARSHATHRCIPGSHHERES